MISKREQTLSSGIICGYSKTAQADRPAAGRVWGPASDAVCWTHRC